jgi:predicted nuclease of restriction endonuclease-like (RecB) superfamily
VVIKKELIPDDYPVFLKDLKQRIRGAQVRAALSVNYELVKLYWEIGRDIRARQQEQGWGTKVIEQLAKDLMKTFPDITGFSSRNLKYMRSFAEAYPDEQIVQQVVALIPWGHNLRLLETVKDAQERIWYAKQTIHCGWSRNVMSHQIESGLYHRQGNALANFDRTLPDPQSELAQQLLKEPYSFEFLSLHKEAVERDLEKLLVNHIRDFLMELGVGFAFLGSQYPITVGTKEYRIDLLFYHVQLHCYVVIDLKMVEFEPEFSGKMGFYITAVDNLLRRAGDEPTIGIILCKSKDKTVVEYALQHSQQPIGVATYRLKDSLPVPIQENMPSIELLEQELESIVVSSQSPMSSEND